MKHSAMILLAFTLTACGGGDDAPANNGPAPVTTGVWLGLVNAIPTATVIAENGDAFLTDDSSVLWTGRATTNGGAVTINATRYTNDATNGSKDTLTATATSATLELTTPAGSGLLAYDRRYENDSSLTLTTGIWMVTGTRPLGDWTITIASDGTFSGMFGSGCMATGQLSIIDSRYNPMALTLTLTLCGALNGDYSGLATLTDEAPGTLNSLSFAFADGVDNGFYFDDIRKQ